MRVSSATIEGMSTTTIAAAAPAVATRNLFKTYGRGEATVHALNNVTIDFERGKFTAIMGPSGSGKSTLMQTLATLDTPDRNPETSIQIGGTELYGQKDNQLTEFRREHVGFIFQAFNLVPTLNRRAKHRPAAGAGRQKTRPGMARLPGEKPWVLPSV